MQHIIVFPVLIISFLNYLLVKIINITVTIYPVQLSDEKSNPFQSIMKYVIFIILSITPSLIQKTFSQVYVGTIPTYYNPSFAGNMGNTRLTTFINYDKRLISGNNPRYGYGFQSISADGFISKLSTGIGINLSMDCPYIPRTYGVHGRIYNAEFIIAPKLSVKGKYTISPSASFNYYHSINNNWGWNITSNKIDSRIGISLQTKNSYFGYSTVFEPVNSGSSDNLELRRQLADLPEYRYLFNYSSIQTGYSFSLNQKETFVITPQFVWMLSHGKSYDHKQLIPRVANVNFRYKKVLAGFGYSSSLEAMLGFQNKKFKVALIKTIYMYSSPEEILGNGYSLSIRYMLGKNENNIVLQ